MTRGFVEVLAEMPHRSSVAKRIKEATRKADLVEALVAVTTAAEAVVTAEAVAQAMVVVAAADRLLQV